MQMVAGHSSVALVTLAAQYQNTQYLSVICQESMVTFFARSLISSVHVFITVRYFTKPFYCRRNQIEVFI